MILISKYLENLIIKFDIKNISKIYMFKINLLKLSELSSFINLI